MVRLNEGEDVYWYFGRVTRLRFDKARFTRTRRDLCTFKYGITHGKTWYYSSRGAGHFRIPEISPIGVKLNKLQPLLGGAVIVSRTLLSVILEQT